MKGEKPKEEKKPEAKSGEKEELDEDGELVTITNDKEKFERYRIFRDLHAARMKRGTSPTLSKMVPSTSKRTPRSRPLWTT